MCQIGNEGINRRVGIIARGLPTRNQRRSDIPRVSPWRRPLQLERREGVRANVFRRKTYRSAARAGGDAPDRTETHRAS